MTIELPDVKIGSQPLTSEQARIELACALYAAWKISMSQAVKIAGMPRIRFYRELGWRKIPLQYTAEDLKHDFEMAEKLSRKDHRRMIVVSDTSSVSALLRIGHAGFAATALRRSFDPRAVRDELLVFFTTVPEFLHCRRVSNAGEVNRLCGELDLGEAEAIALAREMRADVIVYRRTRWQAHRQT